MTHVVGSRTGRVGCAGVKNIHHNQHERDVAEFKSDIQGSQYQKRFTEAREDEDGAEQYDKPVSQRKTPGI